VGSEYFKSPQEAVEGISKLLRNRDWVSLSRYYYLKDSDIDITELESGNFFIKKEQAEVSHPLLGDIRQPFDPAFKYDSHRGGPGDTVFVKVSVKIDQGDGMIQEGFDFFKMKNTPKGLQVLPEDVSEFPAL